MTRALAVNVSSLCQIRRPGGVGAARCSGCVWRVTLLGKSEDPTVSWAWHRCGGDAASWVPGGPPRDPHLPPATLSSPLTGGLPAQPQCGEWALLELIRGHCHRACAVPVGLVGGRVLAVAAGCDCQRIFHGHPFIGTPLVAAGGRMAGVERPSEAPMVAGLPEFESSPWRHDLMGD